MLPSRRNLYFQGFEALSFERCCRKCSKKSCVFWNDDLERFRGGFWDTKNLDFRIVFNVFSKGKSKFVLEAKTIEKNTKTNTLKDFWVGPAECAASRGKKKRGV